jgi:hypothetical protein
MGMARQFRLSTHLPNPFAGLFWIFSLGSQPFFPRLKAKKG